MMARPFLVVWMDINRANTNCFLKENKIRTITISDCFKNHKVFYYFKQNVYTFCKFEKKTPFLYYIKGKINACGGR